MTADCAALRQLSECHKLHPIDIDEEIHCYTSCQEEEEEEEGKMEDERGLPFVTISPSMRERSVKELWVSDVRRRGGAQGHRTESR